MFDLFRSRDKAVRWLLTGMLVLVALSMVTYLIPGSGTGTTGTGADTTVAAQIGKDKITSQDVSRAIQNMTRNRQLPPELLSIYVPQIVNQLINERMLAYEANRMGLKISDDETNNAIIDTLPPQLVKDGKVDGATLNAMLQQEGISLGALKDSTARQLLVNRLQQIVVSSVVVSPKEIENEFRKRNEKVKLQYAVLTDTKYQAEAEPTDAELHAYYDSHKSDFRIPEKRSYAILVLDPAVIGAQSVPTDAQLQSEYNNRRNEFQVPERVKARHILLKADASNDAQVKPKAEALLKQIQGGADFAKLAKENSQDTGSGAQGGELGWIVRGQTVPEFEKSAFSLGVGQTSGLVKTTYGYHIIQVEAHEQAHLQPFEDVKAQLISDYQKRQANQKMQDLSDKAIAALRKDSSHPEQIAQSLGLLFVQASDIAPGDALPTLGASKEFDDAVASLRKGEVTAGPVALPNGKALVAAVTDVQPAHQATFDEAKADVKSRAAKDKVDRLVVEKAKELAAKTQSMGGDLEKAAKSMNIEIRTSQDVDRQGAVEAVGTASTITDAFTKPVGTILGPQSVPTGQLVAKIVGKTPADLSLLPVQMASIRDELKQQKQRDRAQLFQDGLKSRLTADGALKIHQDVINRIVQSYQKS
ncbi:MAG TPA: peptidyl-prolyl cis-trans isomerase [Bryobacteraceae bacterium]|nr:peptidyl-prolyl cis-trans isomerase [Bryobacteraceae bacterium]